jgi:outer membrane immunogenic protein
MSGVWGQAHDAMLNNCAAFGPVEASMTCCTKCCTERSTKFPRFGLLQIVAVVAAACAVACTQVAHAAGQRSKKASASTASTSRAPAPVQSAPVARPHSWTGCYVGANIGRGWEKNTPHDPAPILNTFDLGSVTGSGVVGGGQVGCDYQFAGNWVVGIQGMFDRAGVDGTFALPFAYSGVNTQTYGFKTDWFTTFTGRIGYAVLPQALLYFKGGTAWVRTKYTNADPAAVPPFTGVASATRTGRVIGGGGEYAIRPNWSMFVEYNNIDVGSRDIALVYDCGAACGIPNNTYTLNDKQKLQTILFGVNYRLNGF